MSQKHSTPTHESYNLDDLSAKEKYEQAAIAADSVEASKVAKNILLNGGSIVDATIAGLLVNGLVNAQSHGIGGGFFLLFYRKLNKQSKGECIALDAREVAPKKAHYLMFNDKNNLLSSTSGGLSIAIPGEIAGFWALYQRYGRLKWRDLFQPAINMCKNGYLVHRGLATFLTRYKNDFKNDPITEQIFIDIKTGQEFREGDYIKLPKLANTLSIIANDGANSFYNGSLTPLIVSEIQANGGIVEEEDLKNYQVKFLEPISVLLPSLGLKIYAHPPPSSGILVLFMLLMFQYLVESDYIREESDLIHLVVETSRTAFAHRTKICDTRFSSPETTHFLSSLLEPIYISTCVNNILSSKKLRDSKSIYLDEHSSFREDHGTSHFCATVSDPNGDGIEAISVTSSINLGFGSRVIGEKTHIIYNNQMDDFCQPQKTNTYYLPSHNCNYIHGEKAPASSMCPLIFINEKTGDLRLIIGASGGTRIITAVFQVAALHILLKRSLRAAIDMPRIHNQLWPNQTYLEHGFTKQILTVLQKRGHSVENLRRGGSCVQAIQRRDDGNFIAVSDGRKGGQPAGF
ncbi:unnamed protein product [Didymodactylos carnosus]|uniref:Gamma-glutamyltransferase n=1 Tax=Didymodactylos carnosus TaxID=1234261 RepID=A0A813NRC3_9BILA|nr:unnamed protein product [Didymodactylos carnosus]CAF0774172.1 unnamed protein product [Didymodactylos carnosus]CAF3520407.1 unnamed protein product [Didymodactylos carnosus]CAF3555246.1 unnamed protein product [Didymodactylos carnosus]